MIRRFPALLGLFVAIACLTVHADAQAPDELYSEGILNYESDITVATDGSVLVRETIKVKAAGEQIKRGIYRDFPTRYRDKLGNRYVVGFDVMETQRDGKPENFRVESRENGERVYLGRKDVLLSPGEYTYTITYRTTRQLGFFPDHDELYWNVTGNGWGFPIDKVSAVVTLPRGIQRTAILLDGYTGPQGSLGRAFESTIDSQGRPTFVTTQPLNPAEGLTIVVSWPKGFIAEPTRDMKIHWFLEDNASTLAGLIGLVILLVYYFAAWLFVGKDPARGVIMPLYEPPPGFSPAAVRFVTQMGFDHKTFAAALINMAVKRYVTIEEKDGVYTVVRIYKVVGSVKGKTGTSYVGPGSGFAMNRWPGSTTHLFDPDRIGTMMAFLTPSPRAEGGR